MVSLFYTLSLAASLLSSVAAHGVITEVTAEGVSYPVSQVTRDVGSENPLTDRGSTDLICNTPAGSSTPSSVLVKPGSSVTIDWDWTPAHHPGPIDEFLAFCGDAEDSCNGFDATGDVWFKISETGLLEPSTDYDGGNWASDQLKRDGNKWTFTIPNGIKSGAYLLRHTIIAMHLVGQPEFYPSCTHIFIQGSGTGVPSSSDLVSIPGYLSTPQATEALDFNIFAIYSSFEQAGPRPISFSSSGPAPDPTESEDVPSTTSSRITRTAKRPAQTSAPPIETDDASLPYCDDDDTTTTDEVDAPSTTKITTKAARPAVAPSPTDESSTGTTEDVGSCTGEPQYNPTSYDDEDEDDGVYKRDYSKRFVSGVKVVREVMKRMNGRHGKRRLSEWH